MITLWYIFEYDSWVVSDGSGEHADVGSWVWARQRFSCVHGPQTSVLALHTDLINALMAPCLPANEQLMLSTPAVPKSTPFQIATVMITSSILHEFWCKRFSSTPLHSALSKRPHMIATLADEFLLPSRRMGAVMLRFVREMFVFASVSPFFPALRRYSEDMSQEHEPPCSVFLKQALRLFWHLRQCCFPAAALVLASLQKRLNTDSAQHQHTASKCLRLWRSPWINIYNRIVYSEG